MEETLAENPRDACQTVRLKKDWYTVREMADILKRSEFTVREWCRLGRRLCRKNGHAEEDIAKSGLLRQKS